MPNIRRSFERVGEQRIRALGAPHARNSSVMMRSDTEAAALIGPVESHNHPLAFGLVAFTAHRGTDIQVTHPHNLAVYPRYYCR